MHFLVLKFVTPNSNYRFSKFNETFTVEYLAEDFSFNCL